MKERVVGRHLMLAQDAQDAPRLAIVRSVVRAAQVGAHADTSVAVQSDPEVHALALDAFEFREQPAGRLSIMPNVRARAFATTDTLPRPEPAIAGMPAALAEAAVRAASFTNVRRSRLRPSGQHASSVHSQFWGSSIVFRLPVVIFTVLQRQSSSEVTRPWPLTS
jgi:hypothetical protein